MEKKFEHWRKSTYEGEIRKENIRKSWENREEKYMEEKKLLKVGKYYYKEEEKVWILMKKYLKGKGGRKILGKVERENIEKEKSCEN